MAEQLDSGVGQIDQITSDIEELLKPEVLSKYPDFNREEIDTDESQQLFALNSAFPDGKYFCLQNQHKKRPEPSHKIVYSHGGSKHTIYATQYTFYENIRGYRMAKMEHDKHVIVRKYNELQQSHAVLNEQEIEMSKDRLRFTNKQKDEEQKSNSVGQSNATTAACSTKF